MIDFQMLIITLRLVLFIVALTTIAAIAHKFHAKRMAAAQRRFVAELHEQVARWEGFVFIAYYVAYAAYLVLAAQQHDALPRYSAAMMAFVVPLTVLTMAIVLVRDRRSMRSRAEARTASSIRTN